jgi:hypothetical protein
MKWFIQKCFTPVFSAVDLFIVITTIAMLPDSYWALAWGAVALVASTVIENIMKFEQKYGQES